MEYVCQQRGQFRIFTCPSDTSEEKNTRLKLYIENA